MPIRPGSSWIDAGAFGLTLAVILGAMGLGIMGCGLFAAGDHVIAWLRQGSQWAEQQDWPDR